MIDVIYSADRGWAVDISRQILKNTDFEVIQIDGFDHMNQVEEALETISMFHKGRAICLFGGEMPAGMAQELLQLMEKTDDHTHLILWTHKQVAVKTKLGAYIAQHGKVHKQVAATTRDLSGVIEEEATKRGIKLAMPVVRYLAEAFLDYPGRINFELDKLSLLDETITLDIVKKIVHVSSEQTTNEMVNAILRRDLKASLIIYKQLLAQKQDPLSYIGFIAYQLRRIYQIGALHEMGYPVAKIATTLNISDKQAYYLLNNQVKPTRVSGPLVKQLAYLDVKIKRGEIDPELGFQKFLLDATL